MVNSRNATLEAEVTMLALAEIEASEASRVTVSGFDSTDGVRVEASGASSITGDLRTGDATTAASGASTITLSGGGDDLTLDVSGASSADLEPFPVSGVHAVLSGASQAVVNTDGTIDAEASGASRLLYVGRPTLGDVETSGASMVSAK